MLPEGFDQLALQALHLDWNQFRELPVSFGQLVALRRLYLDENRFAALPESLDQLALQTLHLDWNQLAALPESFGQLAAQRGVDGAAASTEVVGAPPQRARWQRP